MAEHCLYMPSYSAHITVPLDILIFETYFLTDLSKFWYLYFKIGSTTGVRTLFIYATECCLSGSVPNVKKNVHQTRCSGHCYECCVAVVLSFRNKSFGVNWISPDGSPITATLRFVEPLMKYCPRMPSTYKAHSTPSLRP